MVNSTKKAQKDNVILAIDDSAVSVPHVAL